MLFRFIRILIIFLFSVFIYTDKAYSQSLYSIISDEDTFLNNPKWSYYSDSDIEFSRKYLRQFAFCSCIYQQLHINDSVEIDDTDHNGDRSRDWSLSLLREITHYDLSVYFAIDSLVNTYVMELPFSELTGHKGSIRDCIDFYESKFLKKFIRKQDKYYSGYTNKANTNK